MALAEELFFIRYKEQKMQKNSGNINSISGLTKLLLGVMICVRLNSTRGCCAPRYRSERDGNSSSNSTGKSLALAVCWYQALAVSGQGLNYFLIYSGFFILLNRTQRS